MAANSVILLFGFFIVSFVKGQDGVPWPPEPTEIFSEDAEVVSIAHRRTGQAEIRRPVADNERRVLRMFDEEIGTWKEFPYPDEIVQVLWSPWIWNNQLVFAVPTSESREYQLHWIMWTLNIDTAEFEILTLCPGTVVRDTFLDNLQWVFATEVQTGQVYLCHYQTGERHGPLPDKTTFWSDLLFSPDERYLLLRGKNAEFADRSGPYDFYGYEIATGNLLFLGSLGSSGHTSIFDDWLNNEQMLYLYQVTPRDAEYFVMDVSRPHSIESVIAGSLGERRDQPPRLEILRTHAALTRQADLHEHVTCSLDVFDMAAIETHHYILGHNCGGVYSPDGYRYFYVGFQPDPTEMSSLNVLDLRSPEVARIFEGEIEALESVSPDGRYVALITDDNGVIDRNTMEDVQFFSWSQTNNPVVSFVDVSQGQVVYTLPFDKWFRNLDALYERVTHETYASGYPQVGVVWLDDHICLVQQLSDATQEWEHVLLEFTDTGIVNTSLGGYVGLILSDSRYLILLEQTESNTVLYSLYDTHAHEKRLLFVNPYPDDYRYLLRIGEGMRVILIISQNMASYDRDWMEYLLSIRP